MGKLKERNERKAHSTKLKTQDIKKDKFDEMFAMGWQRGEYIQDMCRKKIFDKVFEHQKKQIEEKERKIKQEKLDE